MYSIFKIAYKSPLEILTGKEPAVLWEWNYDEFLGRVSREFLGVNHANWKIPRRGFFLDDNIYWINASEKKLYLEKSSSDHILTREFDKIDFTSRYSFIGDRKDVLKDFLEEKYGILDSEKSWRHCG
ncbi:MAG: hypothetical protein ABIB43_03750 [archaeon]